MRPGAVVMSTSAHTSHVGVARHVRAGGSVEFCPGQRPQHVLTLHSWDEHAAEPGLLLVTLACALRGGQRRAPVEVFARLYWSTGKGQAEAEIDIPGGGTCVSIAGADGLEVMVGATTTDKDWRRTGDLVLRVDAQASWVQAAHPRPAQRTIRAVPGELTPLPDFARRVSVQWPASDPGRVGATLAWWGHDPEGKPTTPMVALEVPEPGGSLPVPAGAELFTLHRGGQSPSNDDAEPSRTGSRDTSILTVWELSL